jgi:large subunit ribosomal protein L21
MIAVIETGGKQFIVKKGSKLSIEKIEGKATDDVVFDRVLLVSSEDAKDVQIGTPYLEKVSVTGKIIEQKKDKKIVVHKYKSKIRYHKRYGHRQHQTVVEITKIGA